MKSPRGKVRIVAWQAYKKGAQGQRFGFVVSELRKLVAGLLVFLFVFGPAVPVFAQVLENSTAHPVAVESARNEDSIVIPTNLGLLKDSNLQLSDFNSKPSNSSLIAKVSESSSNSSSGNGKNQIAPEEQIPNDQNAESLLSGGDDTDVTEYLYRSNGLATNDRSGGFQYSYKLNIPPGRNNFQPDINLIYSSRDNTSNDIFGFGWSINTPYIQRINREGVENLYDDLYFESSLDGELATTSVATTTTFAPRVENGKFRTYSLTDNVWTIKDKKGTTYTFGTTTSGRRDNPGDSTQVYTWFLEEVRDTNDNYIKYEYLKDNGQIYPTSITYTGNGSTDGNFEVEFVTASRSDSATTTDASFEVISKYIVEEIDVKSNENLVKNYQLSHSVADNGTRLLLTSITESGHSEYSGTTTLPSTTFTYQSATKTWSSIGTTSPELFTRTRYDQGVRFGDVNGDGLVDIVKSSYDATNGVVQNVYVNNGTTTSWRLASTTIPSGLYFTYNELDYGTVLVDINGDGFDDIVRGYMDSGGGETKEAYFNNRDGTGWTLNAGTSVPTYFTRIKYDQAARFADVDGDQLVDIIQSGHDGSTTFSEVYINQGDERGWTLDSSYSIPVEFAVSSRDQGVRIADVNGDGLADIVKSQTPTSGPNVQEVYINDGDGTGWTFDKRYTIPVIFAHIGSVYDQGVRLGDINGDGLVDIIQSYTDGISGDRNEVYLNQGDGTGWAIDSNYVIPTDSVGDPLYFSNSGDDMGVRLLDVNGDGMADFLRAHYTFGDSTIFDTVMHDGQHSDLLTSIQLPEGGKITTLYKNSTEFYSDNEIINPKLPLTLTNIAEIGRSDGLGTIGTTTYTYGGGLFYFSGSYDKKFSGFATTTLSDPDGNVTKEYAHQGNSSNSSIGEYNDSYAKIGLIYRVEEHDDSDNLFRKTVSKWDSYNQASNRDYVKLIRKTVLIYDGDGDHKDLSEEYEYVNDYGNLATTTKWGEVNATDDGSFTDTGSDIGVETTLYVENIGSYIVGLSYDHLVVDQSSTTVRRTKTYYDGLALGSVSTGNATKVEHWKSGSSYITTETGYNNYGLATSSTDGRGNRTSYAYDSYNLYPATTTNALSQTTAYEYDYSSGKVATTTDANGFQIVTVFDGFGRSLLEKQPDLDSPSTLVLKNSYTYTDASGAKNILKTGYLNDATSTLLYQYFDGFDRLVQERREAETSNEFNVKDTSYNAGGLVAKQSFPYASTGTSSTSPTETTSLYTFYEYDALGRNSSVANSLGTTTFTYDDWKTTETDARGNSKYLYTNAYDDLVQVDEILNSSTYSTSYTWDLNKKLTKITDAESNIRNFTYDGLGRRLTAQDLHDSGDGTYGTWTYTYDDAGNITQTISPASQTVNYVYDELNRVTSEDYTGSGGTEITYEYDSCTNGVGFLCTAATADATSTYAYNALGQLSSESKVLDGNTYTTQFEYDRQGNQTSIIYPDSSIVAYGYNDAGLLETVKRKPATSSTYLTAVSDIDYAPNGAITFKQFGNGVSTTYTYDSNKQYRLTNIRTIASSTWEGGGPLGYLGGFGSNLAMDDTSFAALATRSSTSVAQMTEKRPLALQTIESETGSGEEVSTMETAEVTVLPSVETSTTTAPQVEDIESGIESMEPNASTEIGTVDLGTVSTTTKGGAQGVVIDDSQINVSELGGEAPVSNEVVDESIGEEGSVPDSVGSGEMPVTEGEVSLPSTKSLSNFKNAHISNEKDASAWRKFHKERVEYIATQKDLPSRVLEQAEYAKKNFEDLLLKEGYTSEKDGPIHAPRLTISRMVNWVWSSLLRFIAWVLPETVYAYVFGVEDFESCSSLPCSFDGDWSWGSVTPSLDHTSKVTGEDSLKEVVTGEGGGGMAKDGLNTSEIWIQFKIWIPDPLTFGGSGYFSALTLLDGSDDETIWLTVEDWGTPRLTAAGDVLSYTNTGIDLVEGAVNTIEIRAKISSSAGDIDIWLDNSTEGSPDYNGSGTLNTGTDNIDVALMGYSYVPESGVSTGYIDDAVINSSFIGSPNSSPSAPSGLETESLTNPTNVSDPTPEFSAVYEDSDSGDVATSYQIQVATSSSFSSPYWDSTKSSLASSTSEGTRIADISYGGSALASSTTYYWRIKFWDTADDEGDWSTATSTFSLAANNTIYLSEDFETCSALPCSFNSDGSWWNVVPSLDHTSKVSGADSLKEVVSGEGGGFMAVESINSSVVWIQFKMWLPDPLVFNTSQYFDLVEVKNASSTSIVYLSVEDYGGSARLIINGPGLSYTDTGLNLVEGEVNAVELRLKKGAADGDVDIWLNNPTENAPNYNGSGSLNLGSINIDRVFVGLVYVPDSGLSTTYYDDFKVTNYFNGFDKTYLSEDFESCGSLPCSFGSNGAWGSVTPSLDSTSKVSGEDSLKEVVSGQGGGFTAAENLNTDEVWTQFKMWIPDPLVFNTSQFFDIVEVKNASSTSVVYLTVEDYGLPRLVLNGPGLSYTDTGLNLVEGEVNTIELRIKKGSTDGDVDVWLYNPSEGVTQYHGGGSQNLGALNIDDMLVGLVYVPDSGLSTTYYDDFEIANHFIEIDTIPSTYVNVLQDISYTYDEVGNITTIVDLSDTGAGKTINYMYDELNRLVAATTSSASSTSVTDAYTYSILGNLLTKTGSGTYSYDETGYANPHAPTSIGNGVSTTTYSYDHNGNLSSAGSWAYDWDYRNRLIESGNGSATSTYTYDHQNDRVSKTGSGNTIYYPSKYYSVSDTETTTAYLYLPDGTLLATVEGTSIATTTNYIHQDHLGSTNVVTDEKGDVVQTLDYYPFGSLRIDDTTSVDVSKKFTGHEFDRESDLTYANARYYDQDIGKFLSQDPAFVNQPGRILADPQQMNSGRTTGLNSTSGFGFGNSPAKKNWTSIQAQYLADPQMQNSYSYARNNPINMKDPEGLWGVFVQGDIGGNAGLGSGFAGQASIGGGFVAGNSFSDPIDVGGYTSYGGLVGGMFHSTTLEGSARGPNNYGVFGLAGGASAGLTFTNATRMSQVGGMGVTNTLNVGIGTVSWSVSKSGVWNITIAIGAKPAISFSTYPTDTKAGTLISTEKKDQKK